MEMMMMLMIMIMVRMIMIKKIRMLAIIKSSIHFPYHKINKYLWLRKMNYFLNSGMRKFFCVLFRNDIVMIIIVKN